MIVELSWMASTIEWVASYPTFSLDPERVEINQIRGAALRDIVPKNQAVSIYFYCWGRKISSYPHILSVAM